MNRINYLIVFLLIHFQSIAQQSNCTNLDAELGDFSNWQGATGTCCPITLTNTGIVNGRMNVVSTGIDNSPGELIPYLLPGTGKYSIRLGNNGARSEAEMLTYIISVTPQSALLVYNFAMILEDDSLHTYTDKSRFEIVLLDSSNQIIPCGTRSYRDTTDGLRFHRNIIGDRFNYLNWTSIAVDLSPYMGQNVTLSFKTGDCADGRHFGYALIDPYCGPLEIQNISCTSLDSVNLSAPANSNYLWSTGDTTQNIVVPAGAVSGQYSVTLTNDSGCVTTISDLAGPSRGVTASFTSPKICKNPTAVFNSTSSTDIGYFTSYFWDFGDGATDNRYKDASHSYTDTGYYNVTLIATNNFGCSDTITQSVLIPVPPTVNIGNDTTVCSGDTLFLALDSAWFKCRWFNGDTNLFTYVSGRLIGVYNFNVIVTDTNYCSARDSKRVTFERCTSVEEFERQIILAPNPFTSEFSIRSETPIDITVVDILGNIIRKQTGIVETNLGADFPNGIYLITFNNDEYTFIKRIIKF